MTKAYFIGGAPRVGKTTALKEFVRRKPLLAASTDAIRNTIRGVSNPADNQDLFRIAREEFGSLENVDNMRNNPAIELDFQNRESEIVWKSVLDFVESNMAEGNDVGIEGVAVLPHNFSGSLPFESKVVFIVNLKDQTKEIMRHAHENTYDWLHKYNDDTIEAFCNFNRTLNQYYFDEANKYHLPVVLVEDDFQKSLQEAVAILKG